VDNPEALRDIHNIMVCPIVDRVSRFDCLNEEAELGKSMVVGVV